MTQRNQYINTRPTADPIEVINEQIRQLDPEKNKEKIKVILAYFYKNTDYINSNF